MREKLKAWKIAFMWKGHQGVKKVFSAMVYAPAPFSRVRACLGLLGRCAGSRIVRVARMVNADDAVSYGGIVVGKGRLGNGKASG